MPCYHPIPAFQGDPGGKVVLHPPLGTANLSLPCGTCIGCRTVRALEWARRCSYEASLWRDNVFVTLTYDDASLPAGGHLVPEDLRNFIKRLRRAVGRDDRIVSDSRGSVRYFACGEYGEKTSRPHYHLLLFNCAFADWVRIGRDVGTSDALSRLWPFGNHTIGTVTGASAMYVAQYSLKKQGGVDCDVDGVVRPAPFVRMSLKPGIGHAWVEEYAGDLQHGYVVADGQRVRIPRYYKGVIARDFPRVAEAAEDSAVCYQRSVGQQESERLVAAEVIHRARHARFVNRQL